MCCSLGVSPPFALTAGQPHSTPPPWRPFTRYCISSVFRLQGESQKYALMHIRQHPPLYDTICLTKQSSFKIANDMTSENATSTMTNDTDCNPVLWDAHNCICLCREQHFFQNMRHRPCSSNNQAHMRFEKVWAVLTACIPEVFRQAADIIKTGVKHKINLKHCTVFLGPAPFTFINSKGVHASPCCVSLASHTMTPASSPHGSHGSVSISEPLLFMLI